jgi:predicted metal-dependent HD superfamily phosphohydrolase
MGIGFDAWCIVLIYSIVASGLWVMGLTLPLHKRWQDAWRDLGLSPPPSVLDVLLARYAEPQRAYHTLDHIRECFENLDAAPVTAERPSELALALWFHDAIYYTRASDNEEQSADWARAVLIQASAPRDVTDRVRALVLVTKHNVEPATEDERLLLDLDLTILGAPEERFDEYEEQIRAEYSWVPEEDFRKARARILREFIARPRLYRTRYFQAQLEARARENLARSLARLAA